jgi:hypothetical protein
VKAINDVQLIPFRLMNGLALVSIGCPLHWTGEMLPGLSELCNIAMVSFIRDQ